MDNGSENGNHPEPANANGAGMDGRRKDPQLEIHQKIKFFKMKKNAVGWFEIPVANMDRAIKFYETVLGIKLSRNTMGPLDMALFPMDEEAIGSSGSLVHHTEFYKPSRDGVLIYLSSMSNDISDELSRVEGAGGEILIPRRQISEDVGFMAVCIDTEGNRIAFHSRK